MLNYSPLEGEAALSSSAYCYLGLGPGIDQGTPQLAFSCLVERKGPGKQARCLEMQSSAAGALGEAVGFLILQTRL